MTDTIFLNSFINSSIYYFDICALVDLLRSCFLAVIPKFVFHLNLQGMASFIAFPHFPQVAAILV